MDDTSPLLQDADEDEESYTELDEEQAEFVDALIKRCIIFCEDLADMKLRPYQQAMVYRFIESLILADGEVSTALFSRQSGKSEGVAIAVSGVVVLFPILARTYKVLERFKKGVWVGVFAPVDQQSEFVFGRIRDKLTSDRAKMIFADPEIDVSIDPKSTLIKLSSGSFIRRQTANPRAKIEGDTLHVAIIDEAQDCDDTVVSKSIAPMLASTAGSTLKIGTPSFHKGNFYRDIQYNKRRATLKRARRNHFQADYKEVGKYNPYYEKYVKNEKLRIGEDSDEFQMSYALKWMLDRGMLITDERLDHLGDTSMQIQRQWYRTPVVVGIDPARINDSTVVTVCWVDWDHPDAAGYREHRILNWLEINNTEYEDQYFQIYEFLEAYDVAYIGVDAQGMGQPFAERLQKIYGSTVSVVPLSSDAKTQHDRWTHLIQLLQRGMVIYPAHSKARRTRPWKRFRAQMEDAEKVIKGNWTLVQAPDDARHANDDYVDSLALACAMSMEDAIPEVEVLEAPWFSHR